MLEQASIKTIARALGVTAAAVSKALNDKPDVGAGLKARVREEAKRQGFVPNRAARGLVTGQGKTLGVYLLNRFHRPVREYFGYHLLDGLLARAQSDDYDLVLLQDHDQNGHPLELARHARGRGVAGLVVFGLGPEDPRAGDLSSCGMPVVTVDTPAAKLPLVSTDQQTGMRAMVEHLILLGHRRIAYIGLRGDGWVARQRREGFRRGMADSPVAASRVVAHEREAVLDQEGGYQAARRILEDWPETTAIVCASDLQAWGALRALGAVGRRVPGDISLSGFDDLQASAMMDTPLTTIAQDPAALGHCAAGLALDWLAGTQPGPATLIPPTLVVRQSTGPAPDFPQAHEENP